MRQTTKPHCSGAALLLILTLFAFFPCTGQQQSTIKRVTIDSSILEKTRTIDLYIPVSHAHGSAHYPLLVILDGEDFFKPFTGMLEYYAAIGKCPEMIIAGIHSRDRWHDYTPTKADIPDGTPVPSSGGGPEFMSFIEKELIPRISSRYRITPFHILYGHSIAGLFTVSRLLDPACSFAGFIATSPSLWWDNELAVSTARSLDPRDFSRQKHLFMTMGSEGPTMLDPAVRFADAMKQSAPENLFWHFEQFPDADHQTMPVKAFLYGIEYLYQGWQIPSQYIEKSLECVTSYYDSLSVKFRTNLTVPEPVLNRMGYTKLRKKEFSKAIEIFKHAVSAYPQSANVYDSLGDAYLRTGDSTAALINYRRSLELNPENENARNIINMLQAARKQ